MRSAWRRRPAGRSSRASCWRASGRPAAGAGPAWWRWGRGFRSAMRRRSMPRSSTASISTTPIRARWCIARPFRCPPRWRWGKSATRRERKFSPPISPRWNAPRGSALPPITASTGAASTPPGSRGTFPPRSPPGGSWASIGRRSPRRRACASRRRRQAASSGRTAPGTSASTPAGRRRPALPRQGLRAQVSRAASGPMTDGSASSGC